MTSTLASIQSLKCNESSRELALQMRYQVGVLEVTALYAKLFISDSDSYCHSGTALQETIFKG